MANVSSSFQLAAALVLIGSVYSACNVGWTEHQGKCYLFDHTIGTSSSGECESYCADRNASILCIENADKEEFIVKHGDNNVQSGVPTYQGMWLQLADTSNKGNFTWGAGCANTGYTNWAPNEPHEGTGENCVQLNASVSVSWNDVPCNGASNSSCYCEKLYTPSCPDGWTRHGGDCYLIDLIKNQVTWDVCKEFCGSFNGTMLCVEDKQKDKFIAEQMGTLSTVWLSYNDIAVEGDWQWDPVCNNTGYTNWNVIDTQPDGSVYQNCAVFVHAYYGELFWADANCVEYRTRDNHNCFCQGRAMNSVLQAYESPGYVKPADDDVPYIYRADDDFTPTPWWLIVILSVAGTFAMCCGPYLICYWCRKCQEQNTAPAYDPVYHRPVVQEPSTVPGYYAGGSRVMVPVESQLQTGYLSGPNSYPYAEVKHVADKQEDSSAHAKAASSAPMETRVIAVAAAVPYTVGVESSYRPVMMAEIVTESEAV